MYTDWRPDEKGEIGCLRNARGTSGSRQITSGERGLYRGGCTQDDWCGSREERRRKMNIVSLDKAEVLSVLKVAREHSELDWLMFAIQYIHAMRISEVLDLTADNIDNTGFMTVQRMKHG